MPVVKVSSWGQKGREQEAAHLRYIARYGTLCDETGASVSPQEVLASGRYDWRRRTTSARVVISLPRAHPQEALNIVLAELADRYPAYVYAYHAVGDDGQPQPHLHVDIMAYNGWAWSNARCEWAHLKGKLDATFTAQNIAFRRRARVYRVRTQPEVHMRRKSTTQIWKDSMAHAVQQAIRQTPSDITAFGKALQALGVCIARQTNKTITLVDKYGNKCRLSKLYPQIGAPDKLLELLSRLKPTTTTPCAPDDAWVQQQQRIAELVARNTAPIAGPTIRR